MTANLAGRAMNWDLHKSPFELDTTIGVIAGNVDVNC